jgi:hypothetical protein
MLRMGTCQFSVMPRSDRFPTASLNMLLSGSASWVRFASGNEVWKIERN